VIKRLLLRFIYGDYYVATERIVACSPSNPCQACGNTFACCWVCLVDGEVRTVSCTYVWSGFTTFDIQRRRIRK
jgi:hypothetical protein